MKMLGILLLGLVGGLGVATWDLVTGGGIESAIVTYLVFGMVFTAGATGFVIWRAIAAERTARFRSIGMPTGATAK